MSVKIKFEDRDYDTDQLSEEGLQNLALLNFTNERVQELYNNFALLRRAKMSYMASLKEEMISSKSGFLFEDN